MCDQQVEGAEPGEGYKTKFIMVILAQLIFQSKSK